METLQQLWESYKIASSRSAANDMGLPPPGQPQVFGVDSARFLKMCKDGKMLDKNFRKVDVDLVFTKFAKRRRLDFQAFQYALVEMSLKKKMDGERLVEQLLGLCSLGPSIHGTFAVDTRLHDDKSTYTGVYKAGGPTTIDYENQGMANLCDRTKRATVRGVPELSVYGPGGINVLMAPSLPKSPFNHLPGGEHSDESKGVPPLPPTAYEEAEAAAAAAGHGRGRSVSPGPNPNPNQSTLSEHRDTVYATAINMVSPDILVKVKSLFRTYTAASSRSSANDMGLPPPPKPMTTGIDSSRFLKLMKDGKVFDKRFRYNDTDVIFAKYQKARRLTLKSFIACLVEVSAKKETNMEGLVMKLASLTINGPSIHGTFASDTRLHDDKSTYTGVYKAGGPTTIDYENAPTSMLWDRSKKCTIRGTPTLMVYGPGDKQLVKSNHNLALEAAQGHFQNRGRGHGYSVINTADDKLNSAPSPQSILGKYATKGHGNTPRDRSRSRSRGRGVSPEGRFKAGSPSANGGNVSIAFIDGQGHSHLTEGPNVGLDMADMEITEDQLDILRELYVAFELHSRSTREQEMLRQDPEFDVFYGPGVGIDSSKFNKLCVEANLFEKNFSRPDVDIVFTKHHVHGKMGVRKLNFICFQNAMLEVAFKKGVPLGSLIDACELVARSGPRNNHGTVAMANRFYDDYVGEGAAPNAHAPAHTATNYNYSTPGARLWEASSPATDAIAAAAAEEEETGPELDMTVTARQVAIMKHCFESYGHHKHKGKEQEELAVDSVRFAKLCDDSEIFDEKFQRNSVDLVFMKHKASSTKRKMHFDGFQNAMLEIAFRKEIALGQLIEEIGRAVGEGPHIVGTVAEANRFYDDRSTYTGQYAHGGPDFHEGTEEEFWKRGDRGG